jgi:hypothetical protein
MDMNCATPLLGDAVIGGRQLIGQGEPMGVPLDREDAPNLLREIDTLCAAFSIARPRRVLFAAELALRVHREKGWFGRQRQATLVIGWPLLQILDADELRAALALALNGEQLGLGDAPVMAHDSRSAAKVGAPLLARTLTRLLCAETIGAERWWQDWNLRARREATPPAQALAELQRKIAASGRGGWHAALERDLQRRGGSPRLDALGGPQLDGGSHRCAAAALLWEGLVGRVWTALESPFAQLLSEPWGAVHAAAAAARERARVLDAERRSGSIELAHLIELAQLVELLAGPRAAFPLFRQAYARERSPERALALARTMAAVDRPRARMALAHLAGSSHALASTAQHLLQSLPDAEEPVPDRVSA